MTTRFMSFQKIQLMHEVVPQNPRAQCDVWFSRSVCAQIPLQAHTTTFNDQAAGMRVVYVLSCVCRDRSDLE